MKITRFLNGRKINGLVSNNIILKNSIISSTIDRVNRRHNPDEYLTETRQEQKNNG
jgi:hypothetical protein